jgi:hypothetical protein
MLLGVYFDRRDHALAVRNERFALADYRDRCR